MILLLMVLVIRQGIANETVQKRTIWKIFQIHTKVFLIGDDYEIWLLHGLEPNSLTWHEWIWREDVSQPDTSYYFDVRKWQEGNTISIVYSPWENYEGQDTYRNDTSLLLDCDYVISNDVCKACVFAKPIQILEWDLLYANIFETVNQLARLGYYNRAADLLRQHTAFFNFVEELLEEWHNKIEGKSFDGQYIAFGEKHGSWEELRVRFDRGSSSVVFH